MRTKLKSFKSCVRQVSKSKGYNPYAVCRTSVGYKGPSRNIGLFKPKR